MRIIDMVLNLLIKLIGQPITLITGDTLVLDRWLWLKQWLKKNNGKHLLDIGCGSGAFSIGAGQYGYQVLGISWDERDIMKAKDRTRLLQVNGVRFEVLDIRHMGIRNDFVDQFDYVICLETIEHIIDDQKLIFDIAKFLSPGGRLLLSTPYLYAKPISRSDFAHNVVFEDGSHVRKGYSEEELINLCVISGLNVIDICFISGFFSQIITKIMRVFSRTHPILGWLVVLPLRPIPPLLDRKFSDHISWRYSSITIIAEKPLLHKPEYFDE